MTERSYSVVWWYNSGYFCYTGQQQNHPLYVGLATQTNTLTNRNITSSPHVLQTATFTPFHNGCTRLPDQDLYHRRRWTVLSTAAARISTKLKLPVTALNFSKVSLCTEKSSHCTKLQTVCSLACCRVNCSCNIIQKEIF